MAQPPLTKTQLAAITEGLEAEYAAVGSYATNRLIYAQALLGVAEMASRIGTLLADDVDATFDWATMNTIELLEGARDALAGISKQLLIGATLERGGRVALSEQGGILLTPNIDGSITVPSRPAGHVDFGK